MLDKIIYLNEGDLAGIRFQDPRQKSLKSPLWTFLARVFCWAKIPGQRLSLPPAYPLLPSKCHTLVD